MNPPLSRNRTMMVLDRVCRAYQSLFRNGHPEQERLVALHRVGYPTGDLDAFHRAYFDHEFVKGGEAIRRFDAVAPGWHGGRVLDFGCGGGGLTARLRDAADHVVGIDLDPRKIEFARAEVARRGLTDVEFVCYDGGTPVPLDDASFDTIVCVDVVEHLPAPERFLAEFRRLLAPGGRLLLSFGPPWGHPHGKHLWSQLPGWWTHLLFPRAVVMRATGHPSDTTWEELGIHRLTVGRFERAVRTSGFVAEYERRHAARRLAPLARLPVVRELFVSEVVGVYRNPGGPAVAAAATA